TADYLKDFGRGALVIERLLDFVEQPHVLDGDYRLVGKSGEQLDLSVRERAHQTSRQDEHADRRSFTHDRHGTQGAKPADPGASQLLVRIGPRIGNVNRTAFNQG